MKLSQIGRPWHRVALLYVDRCGIVVGLVLLLPVDQ